MIHHHHNHDDQEQLEPDLTSSLGQTFILQYKGGGAVDRVQEQVLIYYDPDFDYDDGDDVEYNTRGEVRWIGFKNRCDCDDDFDYDGIVQQ